MTRGAATNGRSDGKDYGSAKLGPRSADRWDDFAGRFCWARVDYGVNDDRAKWGLFSAVEGAQSRLVIAGMDPDRQAMHDISFGEYLQRM